MTARTLAADPPAAAGDTARKSPAPEPLTMTVVTYDYEGVPAGIRAEAERHAARIYREIGIELLWRDPIETKTPNDDGTFVVAMAIASRAMTDFRPEDVLGTAPRGAGGSGSIAYAFYTRISEFAQHYQNGRVGPILGNVFAHEIGHLLLPLNAHSESGLMRADWDAAQIGQAVRGALRFTPEQAALIRRRLTAAAPTLAADDLSTHER